MEGLKIQFVFYYEQSTWEISLFICYLTLICFLSKLYLYNIVLICITTCITCGSCVSWNTAQTRSIFDVTPTLKTVFIARCRTVFSKVARIRATYERMFRSELLKLYNASILIRIIPNKKKNTFILIKG